MNIRIKRIKRKARKSILGLLGFGIGSILASVGIALGIAMEIPGVITGSILASVVCAEMLLRNGVSIAESMMFQYDRVMIGRIRRIGEDEVYTGTFFDIDVFDGKRVIRCRWRKPLLRSTKKAKEGDFLYVNLDGRGKQKECYPNFNSIGEHLERCQIGVDDGIMKTTVKDVYTIYDEIIQSECANGQKVPMVLWLSNRTSEDEEQYYRSEEFAAFSKQLLEEVSEEDLKPFSEEAGESARGSEERVFQNNKGIHSEEDVNSAEMVDQELERTKEEKESFWVQASR